MWGLADTEPPKGSLDESEFYRACKLVAQAQAGQDMSVGNLGVGTPLPAIEGIEQPNSNSEARGYIHVVDRRSTASRPVLGRGRRRMRALVRCYMLVDRATS